jgi:hypothetical protein
MSPSSTPRTEDVVRNLLWERDPTGPLVALAQQLERELSEAKAELSVVVNRIEETESKRLHALDQYARAMERLEWALDKLYSAQVKRIYEPVLGPVPDVPELPRCTVTAGGPT